MFEELIKSVKQKCDITRYVYYGNGIAAIACAIAAVAVAINKLADQIKESKE